MGADGLLPRHILPAAVCALESWSWRTRSGGVDRLPEPSLLFLLHRAMAAGGLLLHGTADSGGHHAVPDERPRWPHLVRLSLSADGLDRPVLCGGAVDRRRPSRADQG